MINTFKNNLNDVVFNTDVKVAELAKALCDALDGLNYYDIVAATGMSEDDANKITTIRNKLMNAGLDK